MMASFDRGGSLTGRTSRPRAAERERMLATLAPAALLALPPVAARAAESAAARQAVVLSSVENMYSAPDADKDVVSQALMGQVVGVLETRGGFVRIATPDAYAGWVPS